MGRDQISAGFPRLKPIVSLHFFSWTESAPLLKRGLPPNVQTD